MNRDRIMKIACLLATTLLMVACTNDTYTDGNGTSLPEGMYPLTFTATQANMQASPQTRVSDYDDTGGSHKSQWTDGDKINVIIGNNPEIGTYTLNADGSIKTADQPVYWQTAIPQTVNAWYSNITDQSTVTSSTVSLADQSKGLAYVLKATAFNVTVNTPINLEFRHQLAKIRAVINGSDARKVTDVKISGYTTCTNMQGTVSGGAPIGDITMYKVSEDIWEANVVPGYSINQLWLNGNKVTLTAEVIPNAGMMHEIDITVGERAIDLSKETNDLTIISDANISGNGQLFTQKITIAKEGAKVTLSNVILSENQIVVAENATIILKGTNSVTGTKDMHVIDIAAGKTLTIDGSDADKFTLKAGSGLWSSCLSGDNGANIIIKGGHIIADARASQAAGIGSRPLKNFGDITIEGGVIEAWGGDYSAGIGGSNYSSCGNINITGGNIKAYGGKQTAGIGNGDDGNCGTITISGKNTVVYAKKGEGVAMDENGSHIPSSIGWNNYNGSCGEVSIDSECKVTQE